MENPEKTLESKRGMRIDLEEGKWLEIVEKGPGHYTIVKENITYGGSS